MLSLSPQTSANFSVSGRLLPPAPVSQLDLGTRLNYPTRTLLNSHWWHINLPTNVETCQMRVFERLHIPAPIGFQDGHNSNKFISGATN